MKNVEKKLKVGKKVEKKENEKNTQRLKKSCDPLVHVRLVTQLCDSLQPHGL